MWESSIYRLITRLGLINYQFFRRELFQKLFFLLKMGCAKTKVMTDDEFSH